MASTRGGTVIPTGGTIGQITLVSTSSRGRTKTSQAVMPDEVKPEEGTEETEMAEVTEPVVFTPDD